MVVTYSHYVSVFAKADDNKHESDHTGETGRHLRNMRPIGKPRLI